MNSKTARAFVNNEIKQHAFNPKNIQVQAIIADAIEAADILSKKELRQYIEDRVLQIFTH